MTLAETATLSFDPASARRAHYAEFFGLAPVPDGFGVVVGNCQAESLRIVIDADDRPTVRIPPVHEMTDAEARRLHELVGDAAFVVTHPIRDGYRGLPLGTAELSTSLGRNTALVTVPSVRFDGLHPFQAALRIPGFTEDPPLVAYHDVRTLAEAIGHAVVSTPGAETIRRIGDDSLAELRRREANTDVAASDLFTPLTTDHMRTVNHAGNAVWLPLADRIIRALGRRGEPTDPGRPLLAAVRAPLERDVLTAWGVDDAPQDSWIVDGEAIHPEAVREAHLDWYAREPSFTRAAAERMSVLLRRWAA